MSIALCHNKNSTVFPGMWSLLNCTVDSWEELLSIFCRQLSSEGNLYNYNTFTSKMVQKKVEKLEFCNLYFADRHSKAVRPYCLINVSHLSVKVFKVFCWKGIIHSLLSPFFFANKSYKKVLSNWLQFYRGQGIYKWSQLMLTLPVMDTSFLSNSFPSTVCISLVWKTFLNNLQKICISRLYIVLTQQLMLTRIIHGFSVG